MLEERCGSCKFWGKGLTRNGRPEPDQGGDWRQCGRVAHDTRFTCRPTADLMEEFGPGGYDPDPVALTEALARPLRLELAVVQDGSGYFAALKSRADFGCVLWEQGGRG